jgi:hypothetical protein
VNTPVAVNNRREARALQRAMADPNVRAFVLVMGELLALRTDAARLRVLQYVVNLVASDPAASDGNARPQTAADPT